MFMGKENGQVRGGAFGIGRPAPRMSGLAFGILRVEIGLYD